MLGAARCVDVAGIVPELYSIGLSGADSEVLIKEFWASWYDWKCRRALGGGVFVL